jgi:hypothetical protein
MFTPRRFGALAGVAFVVLFIAGAGLEGSQPKLSATAAKITSYYTSHHSKSLIADVLVAAAFVSLVVWAAVIAGELRAAGRQTGAGVLLACVASASAVGVVACAIEVGLDQASVHSTDPGFIHSGYLLDEYLGGVLLFLFLVAAATATALSSGGVFSDWYRWISGMVGVLAILGGISVRLSGFFSPTGGGTAISGLALLVWVLLTSALMLMPRPTATAGGARAAVPDGP